MKALVKIFLMVPLSLLLGGTVQAQVFPGIQDTAALRQQKAKEKVEAKDETKGEVKAEVKDQNRSEDKAGNQGQTRTNENAQVKKISGARPDMSKAKGARPGSIVRPAGSRLPKGVGRPGGAPGRGRG